MPATVIAERVGLDGVDRRGSGRTWRGCGRSIAPADPADRLSCEPGDAAQCDLWFPPGKIPLEDGTPGCCRCW